jgi:BirA family biotin operon repressor/biotin-[acetyl-CoA-carboxylase] ligase
VKDAILACFIEAGDRFVSGEEISRKLNVSRTAVWKHIQELKKRGYRFESSPHKGYRLAGRPDGLSAEAVKLAAGPVSILHDVIVMDEVDSTQTVVHRLAAEGAPHGTLVAAEAQTAGKGRMGRTWLSPAGKGIWMSLLIRPPLPVSLAPQMTLVAAVALCRALRRETGADIGIKWPNDLLSADGRKLCGILVESVGEDERVRHMVVGVGIDCHLEEEDYPPELAGKATSLYLLTGRRFDRAALAGAFLKEFDALYRLYFAEGFDPIRTLWESLSVTIGRRICHRAGDRLTEGVAERMDERGGLVVRTDSGGHVTLLAGEIACM